MEKKKPLRYEWEGSENHSKTRRVWDINPVTRTKESKRKFNKDKQREKDRREIEKEERDYQ